MILAANIKPIRNTSEKTILIFRALRCNCILLSSLVIEASATALSADNTISRSTNRGRRGASSPHLSTPSNRGVNESNAAESIGDKDLAPYQK